MSDRSDYKKILVEDQLKRISSDFELDILRLIKTQSMISSTSEIIEKESETVREKSNEFQEILNEFSNKIIEKTRNIPAFNDNPVLQKNINDILSSIEEFRSRTRKIKDHVDTVSRENISRLKSLHDFYSMELTAFQEGLDTRIQNLQNSILHTVDMDRPDPGTHKKAEQDIAGNYTPAKPNGNEENLNPHYKNNKFTANNDDKTEQKSSGSHRISGLPGRYILAAALVALAVIFYLYQSLYTGGIGEYVNGLVSDEKIAEITRDSENKESTAEKAAKEETAEKETGDSQQAELLSESGEKDTTSTQTVEYGSSESDIERAATASEAAEFYTLKVRGANMRKGPGKGYQVVTVLRSGDRFQKTGEETDRWMRIKTGEGNYGWIAKSLVKRVEVR